MNIRTILCRNCRYYQITWDQDKPYGCQKLGFKTNIHPADYIFNVSGEIGLERIRKEIISLYGIVGLN